MQAVTLHLLVIRFLSVPEGSAAAWPYWSHTELFFSQLNPQPPPQRTFLHCLPVFAACSALLLPEIITQRLSQVHCCHLPALHQPVPVVAPDHNWHWGHIYTPRGIWAFLHSFSPCPAWRCARGWLELPGSTGPGRVTANRGGPQPAPAAE